MLSMNWEWTAEDSLVDYGNGLWQIDLGFQSRRGIISAWLLVGGDRLALIETGPASTLENLQSALAKLDLHTTDISDILLTHIHLDHAGAAGLLAQANSDARIYVHPFGAPHVIDPAKLIASATRIYAEQMDSLWGPILPIPEQQVVVYDDGGVVTAAGRQLEVIFTPGHAWHHVALFEAESGVLFTGDAAGIRMPGESFVCPPTPPPDLDPDAWRTSIAAMRDREPKRLCLAHFGSYENPLAQLDALEEHLGRFMSIGEESFAAGEDQEALTARLHQELRASLGNGDPEVLASYELATPSYMAAMGLTRYWKKRSEQQPG
ncbi:MAG: MBL fold metallo-hydrolase [Thermomicrobiales bacterium]